MKSLISRYLPAFLIIFYLTSLLVFNQYSGFADDPGVGWHLKTGELIWESLKIPRTDPFLQSIAPREWVSDQWLSDLAIYLSHAAGGWKAVYLFLTIIFLAAFLVIPLQLLHKEGVSQLAALTAVLFTFQMAEVHFILRPVVISFLLFSLVYRKFIATPLPAALSKIWLPLAAIFLVWCNLHPSFFLGLLLCAYGALSAKFTLSAIAGLIFCVAATFINPYGYRLHESILKLAGSATFMSLHEEWKPLAVSSYEGLLAALVLIIGTIGFLSKRRAIKPFAWLTFFSFGILIFKSVRFLPYFSIAALLPVAKTLDLLIVTKFKVLSDILPPMRGALMIAIIALLNLFPFYEGAYGPSSEVYPYGCMNELRERLPDGERYVVLAHPNWGGFITLTAGKQNIKAIIDDRNTLLGEEAYREFFAVARSMASLRDYITEMGVSHILVAPNGPLAEMLIANRAELIHNCEIGLLFSAPSAL